MGFYFAAELSPGSTVGYFRWVNWTRAFANKAAGKEQPRFSSASRTLSIDPTVRYSRTHSSNTPHHTEFTTPKAQQKSEMSQSRVGESSNYSNNIDSFNNTNSFNNTINNTISFGHVSNVNFSSGDERTEILAWLSLLDPWIRHHDIRTQRVEYVGDWLLRAEEYRNWFDGIRGGEPDNSALFCYGDPGVGKTYIT